MTDVEDPSTSLPLAIVLNPRWTREVLAMRRLGQAVLDTSLAILAACAALDETVKDGDEGALAAWPDRLRAYEALLNQTESAVRSHPSWQEMPTAANTFGDVLSLLRDATAHARVTATGSASRSGEATSSATAATGQAVGLVQLLFATILDPISKDNDRMVRAWTGGLRLRVIAEVPDSPTMTEPLED